MTDPVTTRKGSTYQREVLLNYMKDNNFFSKSLSSFNSGVDNRYKTLSPKKKMFKK